MRKLDTSQITQAAQFFMKQGTLDHLQFAYQEAINGLAISIIGQGYDPTQVYILYGCVNTGANQAVAISAGAVFYQGEVYLVDQINFFLNPGQVAVPIIQLSFYGVNADPVLFTDNVARSVHQVRKMVFVAGASGSGIDLNNQRLPDFTAFRIANQRVSVTGNIVGGQYPNFTVNQVNRILRVSSHNVGDVGVQGSGTNSTVLGQDVYSSYNVVFPDLGTNQYIVSGILRSLDTSTAGVTAASAVQAIVASYSNTGFTLVCKKKDNSSGHTNLMFDYQIMALN